MQILIRPETAADIADIEAVTVAAFRDAAHTSHTEQFIVSALRAAGALSLSLVAEVQDTLVGHAAFSGVSIADGTTGWLGLGPLSVLPRFQRRGVGSALLGEGLKQLRDAGAAGCVVLGDPAYYGRFGFTVDPALVLPGVPSGYFMVLPFGASGPRGAVSYHAAFSE